MKIVVVGASLGGVSACEAIRAAGFDGDVERLSAENHTPYDRPPLSNQLLMRTLSEDAVRLRPAGTLEGLGVRERGRPAVGLDLDRRAVTLDSGEHVGSMGRSSLPARGRAGSQISLRSTASMCFARSTMRSRCELGWSGRDGSW